MVGTALADENVLEFFGIDLLYDMLKSGLQSMGLDPSIVDKLLDNEIVNFFANLSDSAQNAMTSAERIMDILDAESEHDFGKGKAAYLSGFTYSPEAAKMLLNLLLLLTGTDGNAAGMCSAAEAECAWFPSSGKLVIFNNSSREIETAAAWPGGQSTFRLAPMETRIIDG